jgi:hypothetical protein
VWETKRRAFWTTVMFLCTRCKNEILIPSSIFHVSDQQKRVWNIPRPSIPQKNFSFHYAWLPDTMHLRKVAVHLCSTKNLLSFSLNYSQYRLPRESLASCGLESTPMQNKLLYRVRPVEERNLSDPSSRKHTTSKLFTSSPIHIRDALRRLGCPPLSMRLIFR